MVNYRFAILDPRPIPLAQAANEDIFSAPCGICLHSSGELDRQVCHECGGTGRVSIPVLGIEVTIPALAARCSLGNIDPQHDGSGQSLAAIEAAFAAPQPLDGTTFATVRPDLDSFGAMALFVIRVEVREEVPGLLDRIQQVAAADKARQDEWPGIRDLSAVAVEEQAKAAPLAAIAAAVADFRVTPADRVAMVREWLLTGAEPVGYRDRYVAAQLEAARAYESGAATVVVEDGIAVVTSTHRAATAVGYAHAPVVVAVNHEFRGNDGKLPPHTKYTVCQYSAGYVNMAAVQAELSAREPGWGGSPALIGSPQGVGSELTIDEVIAVVKHHLK